MPGFTRSGAGLDRRAHHGRPPAVRFGEKAADQVQVAFGAQMSEGPEEPGLALEAQADTA
jgi:hypothetical protein